VLRLSNSPADIARAAECLRRGELVAFPTETVYGLGADAANPAAVARIFAAKGRPADHPLIVHVADAAQFERLARHVPDAARRLAAAFWPGPLTLIVERAPGVPDAVTGGQDTVGVRVPSHPVARALLAAFGGGVAAPSANRFGRVSPTTAQHVVDEFGAASSAIAAVIDGGACDVGIESTIVDVSRGGVRVLRPGGVSAADVERVAGVPLDQRSVDVPRVSGSLASHYAPNTPVELVRAEELLERVRAANERLVVLARTCRVVGSTTIEVVELPRDPPGYAHAIYAALRAADEVRAARILVEEPPDTPEWLAVRDRLLRATHVTRTVSDTGSVTT
jgi:L-threonylcarbamoyladenylate synthase